MTFKVGQKVITLDDEQGFISCVYDCGSFDVDILDDNGIDAVTVGFDVGDTVRIPPDQTPQLEDITPLGVVLGVHTCNSLAYAGLWLSRERVNYLECYGEIVLPHGCWVDCESVVFDDVLNVFDLMECDTLIVNATLRHYDIPEQCVITVALQDTNTEAWRASVDGDSQITEVYTPEGKVTSLGEFRDVCNRLGVIDTTLNSEYRLKGF